MLLKDFCYSYSKSCKLYPSCLTLLSGGELIIKIFYSRAVLLLFAMTLQFTVSNMACSACVATITQAVIAVDPSAKVEADTKTKQVNIETQKPELEVKQAIATAGYTIS